MNPIETENNTREQKVISKSNECERISDLQSKDHTDGERFLSQDLSMDEFSDRLYEEKLYKEALNMQIKESPSTYLIETNLTNNFNPIELPKIIMSSENNCDIEEVANAEKREEGRSQIENIESENKRKNSDAKEQAFFTLHEKNEWNFGIPGDTLELIQDNDLVKKKIGGTSSFTR